MVSEKMSRYLELVPEGVSEIYLHPATQRPEAYPAHYDSRGEYEALIDPAMAEIIARRGIATVPFAGI
jgi:hypothetical protein